MKIIKEKFSCFLFHFTLLLYKYFLLTEKISSILHFILLSLLFVVHKDIKTFLKKQQERRNIHHLSHSHVQKKKRKPVIQMVKLLTTPH